MAQIWNNLQLNNAKSIADVRASALEWYSEASFYAIIVC